MIDLRRRVLRVADIYRPRDEADLDEDAKLRHQEARAWQNTEFWIGQARDGLASIGGKIPELYAELLKNQVGTLLPEVVDRTGLPASTPVLVGIHDSNASLLPHLLSRQAPFSVLSTGTWVIALAVGAKPLPLDPARDTLINVNAQGQPTPSARFMGGRENALLGEGLVDATEEDIEAVFKEGVMYLPSAQQGSGPFPDSGWRA